MGLSWTLSKAVVRITAAQGRRIQRQSHLATGASCLARSFSSTGGGGKPGVPSSSGSNKKKDDGPHSHDSVVDGGESESMPSSEKKAMESAADFLKEADDADGNRVNGIQVNPNSIGASILPGNLVYKHYKYSGTTRKIPVEFEHGYYWMIRDIEKNDSKTILSNEELISEYEADIFPTLTGLKSLSGRPADLPFEFVNENDGDPTAATCTLAAISFREHGNQLLSSWTEPFLSEFGSDESKPGPRVLGIDIIERLSLYPLQWALTAAMRSRVPEEDRDRKLLYFGVRDVPGFCDALRMHNLMTGYVFLIDDEGRVRFAGSGKASDDEVSRLIRFAKKLSRESRHVGSGGKKTNSRKSRKR